MKHHLIILNKSLKIYSGIYKIDFPNGKSYIGQAQNIVKRIKEHNQRANKGHHGTRQIQICERAIQKYGNVTEFEILEIVNDISLLNEREAYWINYYNTNNKEKGYNLTNGGDVSNKRGTEHPNAFFTEETLQELIQMLKENKISMVKIAEYYNVNPETIRRINKGDSYTNPNIHYPIRDPYDRTFAKKEMEDYFDYQTLINIKEDLKYRWDLTIEQDIKTKYNISLSLLRDINYGRKFSEIGAYNYPIRGKNIRNKNNLTQQDILDILNLLANTKETMEKIGNKYNFGRAVISNINNGIAYPIKDYNYPARKTK